MKKSIMIAALAFSSVFSMAQSSISVNPIGSFFSNSGGATPAGTFRLTSGGYEVYTITSADKDFQPSSLYYGEDGADQEKVDALAPNGKVPTAMNCFVVRTPDGYIMFDTGLPSSRGGQTLSRLESLGISPKDIKAIFLTHGHFDHIGGLLDEAEQAVFPNADLYIPSAELAFIRESMKDAASQIEAAYKDRTVIFEPGTILPRNVLPISAKGHTPGHTAYRVGDLLFVGDIMHGSSIQLIDPEICASYDADRSEAIASRISILSYAAANSLTVLGAHISLNGLLF